MTQEIEQTDVKRDAARAKLLEVLPHLRFAAKDAAEGGDVAIGILSVKPDGSGTIVARFAAGEFFDDLATALDAPAQTEDDDLDAAAVKLLQRIAGG